MAILYKQLKKKFLKIKNDLKVPVLSSKDEFKKAIINYKAAKDSETKPDSTYKKGGKMKNC